VTRNLDDFVWVVIRAVSPNISFFVAMLALKNPQEFVENCFPHNIRQIIWPDAQDPFKCVIVGDGGTGMEV